MTLEPLHIMFLVSSLCFGGAEKHVVTLANGLDRSRFRCSLVYLKPNKALLPQLDLSRLEAVISLNVRRRIDCAAVKVLAGQVDRLGVDIMVCTNEYPAVYALLASRRARARPKIVEVFHTTVFGTLKDRMQMLVYQRVFRHLDRLIYVSRNQQAYWRAKGLRGRSDSVIRNGIDTAYFKNTFSANERAAIRAVYGFSNLDYVIGICAALRPEKAHGDLLQAIAILRARGISARCLIIGDGPERPKIETLISSLALTHTVAISGFIQDVRPYVACCDVMVLASHSVETFSIAALEAMALGKPVILSRIGGADEQIVDGVHGCLFDAGNIQQLADCLQSLSAADQRQHMGERAAERVRTEFTQDRMLAEFNTTLAGMRSIDCSN